jgi:hypothetical protein
VSLRDPKGQEVALINDLDQLDDQSRQAVEEALHEVSFVFDIVGIDAIETEFEIRNWKVKTLQGDFTFQTKHDDWPRPMREGGFIIRDIDSNLFRIADPKTMDEKSQKLFWAYTD